MTQDISNADELISALADGELDEQTFAQALAWLDEHDVAREKWHAYHLVGDVLRSGELAPAGANDAAFLARLRQRLQGEALMPPTATVDLTVSLHSPSANDPSMKWKLIAGFASLAAVAVLGWQTLTGLRESEGAPQLARVEALPASEPAQFIIRDARLDQLLAAHQQSGSISALQMPAGFLRDATFTVPAR